MLILVQVSAASVFGQIGAAGNAGYCASKAAVMALSRTAAKENPTIRINCVAPGNYWTVLCYEAQISSFVSLSAIWKYKLIPYLRRIR